MSLSKISIFSLCFLKIEEIDASVGLATSDSTIRPGRDSGKNSALLVTLRTVPPRGVGDAAAYSYSYSYRPPRAGDLLRAAGRPKYGYPYLCPSDSSVPGTYPVLYTVPQGSSGYYKLISLSSKLHFR
eukprot:scaffold543393_cov22-Prasinocladus_malaysianus.AAC.1